MLGPIIVSWQRVFSMSSWLILTIMASTMGSMAIRGHQLNVSRKSMVIVPCTTRYLLGYGPHRRLCSRRGCQALADYLGVIG
jgi:hypothetical protein